MRPTGRLSASRPTEDEASHQLEPQGGASAVEMVSERSATRGRGEQLSGERKNVHRAGTA